MQTIYGRASAVLLLVVETYIADAFDIFDAPIYFVLVSLIGGLVLLKTI